MTEAVPQDAVPAVPEGIYCPKCAYDLRGTTSDLCVECGYSLANLRAPECRIPWEKRKQLGRFRTYWKTVWMVTVRFREFGDEYAHDVDYRSARRFQYVTIMHLFPLLITGTVFAYIVRPPNLEVVNFFQSMMAGTMPRGVNLFEHAYADVWPVAFLLGLAIPFLVAATGVPSYFFHPNTAPMARQNSCLTLSYYSCGPLAWSVISLVILAASLLVCTLLPTWIADHYELWGWSVFVTAIWTVLTITMWWSNLELLAKRTMPQIRNRAMVMAVALPLLWLALVGLFFFVLPVVVLYVLVVIASLT